MSFIGSIPELYERYFVPLIFESYAEDMAQRVAACSPASVLEVAAGTGVVTRALARHLPPTVRIASTDLNQPMIDHASARPLARPIEWRQADACALPFDAGSFDVVVCQFGAMFFPDKPLAFGEARRVLKSGGRFFFSVWDRIEENEFADVATNALASVFPDDPPRFMALTPHGYWDRALIERHVAAAGFTSPVEWETVTKRSRAASAREAAIAYCQANPLCLEIQARGPSRLEQATAAVTEAIAQRFGGGAVDGKIQAHVVTARA